MDKELIRTKLYEFLEYRKNYLKEKKVLILEILTNKSNERVSELKSLKEKYFQEFNLFNDHLPTELRAVNSIQDEDLIFWLIFTLNGVLNVPEEDIQESIMKKPDWTSTPKFN
jgi:hypothetical protein